MNTLLAEDSQSLLDICLQVNGNLDNLVALATLNDLAVEATVEAQAPIKYAATPSLPQVAKVFQLNGTRIITGNASVEPLVVVPGETSNGRKTPFPVAQPLSNQYQLIYGQSLLDICLQLTGTLDTLVALSASNQTVITVAPATAGYLGYDPQDQKFSPVAERFRINGTYVTTLDNAQGLSTIQTEFENSEYEGEEYA